MKKFIFCFVLCLLFCTALISSVGKKAMALEPGCPEINPEFYNWTAVWTDAPEFESNTTYKLTAPCKVFIGIPFEIKAWISETPDCSWCYIASNVGIFDGYSTGTAPFYTYTALPGGAGGIWDGQWQQTVNRTYFGDPVDHDIEFKFIDHGDGAAGHGLAGKAIGGLTVDPFPPGEGPADISVDPSSYDFGDVETGEPSTMILSITNNGGTDLTINDIDMQTELSSDPFTVHLPSLLPITITPASAVDVEVSYSPSILFAQQSNTLIIKSDDLDSPVIEVALTGRGVLDENPSQAVSGLQAFIDTSLENEMITGEGPNEISTENRINVLKNMIESAGDLIEAGNTSDACEQLQSIYMKVDSMPKPPDFISGDAVPGVGSGISEIMSDLGCP